MRNIIHSFIVHLSILNGNRRLSPAVLCVAGCTHLYPLGPVIKIAWYQPYGLSSSWTACSSVSPVRSGAGQCNHLPVDWGLLMAAWRWIMGCCVTLRPCSVWWRLFLLPLWLWECDFQEIKGHFSEQFKWQNYLVISMIVMLIENGYLLITHANYHVITPYTTRVDFLVGVFQGKQDNTV